MSSAQHYSVCCYRSEKVSVRATAISCKVQGKFANKYMRLPFFGRPDVGPQGRWKEARVAFRTEC